MRAMILTAPLVLLLATPALAEPADFLKKAVMGDNSEITLGKLAEKRGSSSSVRRFGAMLAADHGKAKQEAMPLLKRYKVPATTAMMPEAEAERTKLAGLSGAAFDREFASYMVNDHKQDISDFEDETKSNDPADVVAMARKTIPVLQKHLQTAQSIKA